MFERKNINRVLFVEIGFGVAVALIVIKLFWVQIIQANYYEAVAMNQYEKPIEVQAKRGDIFDRNGRRIAFNEKVESFFAITYQVEDTSAVDSVFCHYFGHERGYYSSRFNHRGFVYLERLVDFRTASEIKEHNFAGVGTIENYRRVYPFNPVGAQVLGHTNIDNVGQEGIELYYNETLAGKAGEFRSFADGIGNKNPILSYGGVSPIDGNNIQISIDIELQSMLEYELAMAVDSFKAAGGWGVFLDPHTGQVLAMTSFPSYDPENIGDYNPACRKNRAVTDIFEPGSIFKVITYSCAVGDSNFNIEDSIFCENGRYPTRYKVIEDSHPDGWLSLEQVLVKSSNIGTIKLAGKIDNYLLYDRAKSFGFGSALGIDFPGEMGGTLHKPHKWSPLSELAFPMGYEVTVTPLQVASAYSAIANGGVLYNPYFLLSISDDKGNVKRETEPLTIRRVLDERTDSLLIQGLSKVVLEGTARRIGMKDISMAGKTGTAKKVKLGGGGYFDSAYIGSFVGFAPVENPQIVGVVSIDNSTIGIYYGGSTAGPVFRNMVRHAANMGIIDCFESEFDSEDICELTVVPDLTRMNPNQAKAILDGRGLNYSFSGLGDCIISQTPNPGTVLNSGKVNLELGKELDMVSEIRTMPEVKGLTLREALNSMKKTDIDFKFEGNGIVSGISHKAGTEVNKDETVTITCK